MYYWINHPVFDESIGVFVGQTNLDYCTHVSLYFPFLRFLVSISISCISKMKKNFSVCSYIEWVPFSFNLFFRTRDRQIDKMREKRKVKDEIGRQCEREKAREGEEKRLTHRYWYRE